MTEAGIGFAYHNHGYEFDDWGGTTGFEIILAETNPDWVKLQMDMYWAVHSGTTPKALVAEQPGRYVMWHIKDMDTITRDYTELGNGSIDYVSMLPDPVAAGLEYYYIEQGGILRRIPCKVSPLLSPISKSIYSIYCRTNFFSGAAISTRSACS